MRNLLGPDRHDRSEKSHASAEVTSTSQALSAILGLTTAIPGPASAIGVVGPFISNGDGGTDCGSAKYASRGGSVPRRT
jgi:hypothetical protein